MAAILDFTDVKKVMEGRGGEGREGGDQARFFMWIISFSPRNETWCKLVDNANSIKLYG